MKIAFFASQFPCISETFVSNQARMLIENGHEVDIFAGRPHPDIIPSSNVGISPERIHYWPNQYLRGLGDIARSLLSIAHFIIHPCGMRRLLSVLRKPTIKRLALILKGATVYPHGPYDLLYCHYGHVGQVALSMMDLCDLGPARLVVVFHANDLFVYPRLNGEGCYEELFRRADLLLPVASSTRNQLLKLGAPAVKTEVQKLGVDVDRFCSDRPGRGPFRMISVVRLVEKKGVDVALHAVKEVISCGIPVHFDIFGDGPERKALIALARELGIDDLVTFHGWCDTGELPSRLAEAHLYVSPSRCAADGDREGIPVAIMEAMSCGLPVVSTLHSGIPELVRDGESGFLVPENSPESIASKIVELAMDHEKCEQFGHAGRRIVEREFNSLLLSDQLLGRLQKLNCQQ